MQRQIISILFLCLALTLLSCSSNKNPAGSQEPAPTEEAQLAALWLSDEEFVPEDLALKIQNGLALLREHFSDEIPQVNNKFVFPAEPKLIVIEMESDALKEVEDGTYHSWDNLNQRYGIDSIIIWGTFRPSIRLISREHINPYAVAPKYEVLPGVRYAYADEWGGDWSNIYPWFVEGRLAFLVREAWGDCPSGCIFSKFWYFKSSGDQINLIGNFEMDEEWWQNPIYPDWWDEAAQGYYKYRHFGVVPE